MARSAAGGNLQSLARACGASVRSVYRWKQRQHAPPSAMRRLLELAAGVPVHVHGWDGWRFVPHDVPADAGRSWRRETVLMNEAGEYVTAADLAALPLMRAQLYELEQARKQPAQLTWIPLDPYPRSARWADGAPSPSQLEDVVQRAVRDALGEAARYSFVT